MRISRQLAIAAMLAVLVAPGSVHSTEAPAPPDDLILGDADWRSSEDGTFFVYRRPNGASFIDAGLDIAAVSPEAVGAPLDTLGAEADLHEVTSGTDVGGFGVVRLRDPSTLSFFSAGHTPAILEVSFDERGGSFLQDQRVIDLPPACTNGAADGDGCLPEAALRDLAGRLITNSVELPPGVFPPVQLFEPLDLVGTGVSRGSGTHTGFGGGIGVETTLDVSAGDSYEVRATATISELFGGDATVASTTELVFDADGNLVEGRPTPTMLEVVRRNGVPRFVGMLDCPRSGAGVAVTDVLIEGAGANLASNLGPGFEGLAGGTDVVVTTVDPFVCPGSPGGAGGPGRTFVSLVCFGYATSHTEHEARAGKRLVVFPSFVKGFGVVMVMGTDLEALRYSVRSALDRGRRLRGLLHQIEREEQIVDPPGFDTWRQGLEGEDTGPNGAAANGDGSTDHPLLRLYEFEFEGGIDSIGPKRLRKLLIEGKSGSADLTKLAYEAIGGKSFGVKRRETSGGNCPDDLKDLDLSDLDVYLPVVLR